MNRAKKTFVIPYVDVNLHNYCWWLDMNKHRDLQDLEY